MGFWYYKYRTDFNNTLVDKSRTAFTLGVNENQVFINYEIVNLQPLYLYRYNGSNIIVNQDNNIKNYLNSINGTPNNVSTNTFANYTGTTAPNQFANKTKFNSYTGTTNNRITTVENNYVSGYTSLGNVSLIGSKLGRNLRFKGLIQGTNIILTPSPSGITISASGGGNVSVITFNSYTGTTAPNQFANRLIFNSYTGITNTAIGNRLLISAFNTYSGTTAPILNTSITGGTHLGGIDVFKQKLGRNLEFKGLVAGAGIIINQNSTGITINSVVTGITGYVTSLTFNGYTGTTAPNQFANRTIFNSYTGTTQTAINNRLLISTFNSYTGTTQTAINNRLLTSVFNTYSGATLTNINSRLLSSAFNSYTGATQTALNNRLLITSFNTYTGTTAPAQFANRTIFNSYTGTTNTAINNRLLTSAFNTYSGATLSNINSRLLTSNFNTYSGATGARLSTVENNYVTGYTSLGNVTLIGSKLGRNLRFKGLIQGANIILTSSASGVTIAATSGGISSANNGLRIAGANLVLGGTLTGGTTIGLGASNLIFTGTTGTIRYGSDLSANYNIRSLTDVGYVTGLTSQRLLISNFNTYSGATLTNINSRLLISNFNTYTGATQTALNNRLLTSAFNTYSGLTLTNINSRLLSSAFNTYSGATLTNINTRVNSANNGITRNGTNVRLGGSLTGNTNIGLNTFNLNVTGSSGTLTAGSSRFAILNPANTFRNIFVSSAIAANRNITIPLLAADDTLVTAAFTQTLTNKTLTTPSINGLTSGSTSQDLLVRNIGGVVQTRTITSVLSGLTANNGIRRTGNNFRLGGTLTGGTTIGLGISNLIFTGTTGTIRYGSDLSANYNIRSLTDVGYVTGLTSQRLLTTAFNTYSGATLTNINSRLLTSAFNTYSGTTLTNINSRLLTSLYVTYTGTTAPNQFANRAIFNSYSGTTNTAINNRLLISSFNTYSGATLTNINNRLLTSAFNTYSGVTATRLGTIETNYVSGGTALGTIGQDVFSGKVGRNLQFKKIRVGSNLSISGNSTNVHITFTGSSGGGTWGSISGTLSSQTDLQNALNAKLNVSLFNTYTGTTAPNQFANRTIFNTYTGTTNTAINSRLLTSAFNTYSANTETQINNANPTYNNGLRRIGTNVRLGGNLTGSTNIGLNTLNLVFTGTTGTLRYGANYSANYNVRSLPDVGYVTGLTSGLLSTSAFNTYSGATLTNINSRLLTTAFNTYSGVTASRLGLIETLYLSGATNLGSVGQTLLGVTAKNVTGKRLRARNGLAVSGTTNDITYYFTGSTGGGTWGSITGTLSGQTDLQNALNLKVNNTLFNSYTGTTNGRITTVENNYVTGYTSLGNESIIGSKLGRNLRFKGLIQGTNVTLTPSPSGITISASGTGSTFIMNTVEVNVSSTARSSGYFFITGSSFTPNKAVLIQQANGPYTGKGTLDDETEMDMLIVSGKVLNGTTIKCFWLSQTAVKGNFKFNYRICD
jgi:fibronectin-binding autotransporter adhesin